MASASRALLVSLLRQSDRHPIGLLDGHDLAGADPGLVDVLLSRGVLRELAPQSEADGRPVVWNGADGFAITVDGDEVDEPIDAETLRQFSIDHRALAELIHESAGLTGPVESFDGRSILLGRAGRDVAVALLSSLGPANLMPRCARLRELIPSGRIVLLTPSDRDLGADLTRQLRDRGMDLASVEALLADAPTVPMRLDIASVSSRASAGAPRLVVCTNSQTIRLDDCEIPLPELSFKLLTFLTEAVMAGASLVSNRKIEEHLWATQPHQRAVDDAVRELRDALADGHRDPEKARQLIVTVKARGKRLDLTPEDIAVR